MNNLSKKLLNDPDLIGKIHAVADKFGYTIFTYNDKYPINLNLWGVRSEDNDTSTFNDTMLMFHQLKDKTWIKYVYDITTDPSNISLEKPVNKKGAAILKEGQYRGLWKVGLHKGQYEALVQHKPCTVYRDNNKDAYMNFGVPLDSGMFGINCHRASMNGDNKLVGLYGAGCQVHQNTKRYINEFMPIIKDSIKNDSISYTLIKEDWLL